ncbi:MAG: DUF2797 domain-containing protein [Gammaproteobacteria bacterium]|nr:DUF2797 domain-containing protein [Gammaproteobacteria bacterium]
MHTEASCPVCYRLELGGQQLSVNEWLGKSIRIEYLQQIECIHCGRITRKSFSQGFCYPCFSSLAQCDLCIVSPEKCHFHLGTCREPDWGQAHCMRPHIIYLSNTSGVKIGITRETQIPTRWIDQGAIQAIPILRVSRRYHAGLIEHAFKQHVNDRTNWRNMLKNEVEEVDLYQVFESLWPLVKAELDADLIEDAEEIASTDGMLQLDYPALHYPSKISSFNLDKNPVVEGKLDAIKGQYLILDNGVINIRKYGGYLVSMECD